LQCSIFHATGLCGSARRFRWLVFPNFLLWTWMPPAALAALLTLWKGAGSGPLGLDAGDAAAVSLALVYLQRGAARLACDRPRPPWRHVVLEPVLTSIVGSLSFAGAVASALRQALRQRRMQRARQ
jgi:hypothetical protein